MKSEKYYLLPFNYNLDQISLVTTVAIVQDTYWPFVFENFRDYGLDLPSVHQTHILRLNLSAHTDILIFDNFLVFTAML